ncbi:MAG: hypothetical protein GC206_12925 [Alphaproteobacteria bacterium]|nr:hypothetical protein [Alphaproteobacteria bacterium]
MSARRLRQTALVAACAAAVIILFVHAVSGLENEFAAMNMHGWLALALGAGLTLLLGAGLMALVFFSARKGYDDRVADPLAPELDERERD